MTGRCALRVWPAGPFAIGLIAAGLAWGEATPDRPAIPAEQRRPGTEFLLPETRAMQDDDMANPGMLFVAKGAELWRRAAGRTGQSCALCHGDAAGTMKGVAVRYPEVDAGTGKLLNLEQRIQHCRAERQQATPLAYESDDLLALTAYVAHQSRGLPIVVRVDGPAKPYFEAGRALYTTRQGQLNLACAQCHDENWGKRLLGETISQGQPTGYPIYRLEWQGIGSLHRRLRSCLVGVRAEPFAPGAAEYVALELYLMWRAQGLRSETPAIRR
ncbi:MAG: sulfur oxidation c-type cytochrome SoxA [Alphaproteobacteria bacterium]